MKRLLLFALLALAGLLLALVAVGVLAQETGPAEKVVLIAFGVAVLVATTVARRRLA